MNRSLIAFAAVISLGGIVLAGCGGSSISPYSGSTATPRPGSPTPIPTTTPTETPPANSGTLAAYFGTVSNTARLTYRDVTTTTTPDPISGENTSNTTTTTYTTGAVNPFSFGNTGNSTQVTLATAQGNMTVTRQEELEDGMLSATPTTRSTATPTPLTGRTHLMSRDARPSVFTTTPVPASALPCVSAKPRPRPFR